MRVVWEKRTMSRWGLASIMHIKWSCIHSPKKRCSTLLVLCWCKQYHKITKWMQAQEKSAFSQWNWYFPGARSLQLICTSMKMGPKIFYGTVFSTQSTQKSLKMSLHLNYFSFRLDTESFLYFNIQSRNLRKYKKCFYPVKSLFSHTCGHKEPILVGCLVHNFGAIIGLFAIKCWIIIQV